MCCIILFNYLWPQDDAELAETCSHINSVNKLNICGSLNTTVLINTTNNRMKNKDILYRPVHFKFCPEPYAKFSER